MTDRPTQAISILLIEDNRATPTSREGHGSYARSVWRVRSAS
jgi:hypothetical protein